MSEIDLNFLPLIYDIIRSIEKDSQSHDVPTKLAELKSKLQKSREAVEKLPGIDLNKTEQLKQLHILQQQFINKTELLQKYKNKCNIEFPG
ncbi:mediator of RNA polymerase II transcription subunit 9-like [Tubulanus polymorphus]|uniref:mediator of RNA polymerase II transcription subunit 9-like n=1 Tax=Tubulanus polymorphus TaxID=672921 RepID=UPI003DA5C090